MRRAFALATFVVVPALVMAQVSTKDFARGAEIRTDGGGSLYRIELPDEVYDTSTRVDLADMRVLNATGETVPYTLREVPRSASPESAWRLVPSFPMSEAESGAAARTHVKVGADGAVLEVTNDRKSGRSTTAYLVDATGLTDPISRMSLIWEAAPGATFLVPVSVSASDDLNSWRTIVPSAAIAQLRRDTFMLTQNEIELPGAQRAKYFRISWPRELAAVTVKSVRLRPRTNAAEPEIHWRTVSAERVDPVGTAQYDTHAFLPIEYLDLEFADPIDTDLITIRSRPASTSPWELSHSGLFYVLQGPGGPIRSPYVHIGRTTERYWTVETTREGGWKQNRAPRLKVGWHPHELVFVARGPAPYTLAYGSGRVGPADAPVGELLASLSQAGDGAQVRVATLGQPRSLSGADALEPLPTPLPWKRIVLWAVLIVAVGALAFVAARLLRETKNAT
ncbi:MAG TPA: DUF3999 domain-containing protein [Vicinamibacterales bacterium]|nr:DUF3999 domain-containing protein [Vicinamibacterales bacterium]